MSQKFEASWRVSCASSAVKSARSSSPAFALLFCVLGGYFAVRPIRETVGTILGREASPGYL